MNTKFFLVSVSFNNAPSDGDASFFSMDTIEREVDPIVRGDLVPIWLEVWEETSQDVPCLMSFPRTQSHHSPLLQHS